MSRLLCSLGACTLCASLSFGQATTKWSNVYTGLGLLKWGGAAIEADGRLVVTGTDFTFLPDLVVRSYTTNGNPSWTWVYPDPNGTQNDYGSDVTVDQGNVFVLGHTDKNGGDDTLLGKLDAGGAPLWATITSAYANRSELVHRISVEGNGNITVSGDSGLSPEDTNWLGLKFDPNGVFQWIMDAYGTGSFIDTLKYHDVLPNGTTVFFGDEDKGFGISVQYDTRVVFCNGVTGSVINTKAFGTTDPHEYAEGLTHDAGGNVYLLMNAGTLNSTQTVIKLDSLGNTLWTVPLVNTGDTGHGLKWSDAANCLYMVAIHGSDLLVDKFGPDGSMLWTRTVTSSGLVDPYDLACDKYGNVVVTGSVFGVNYDMGAWCFDPSGNLQWSNVLNGADDEIPFRTVLDDKLRCYVAGNSKNAGGNDRGIAWCIGQFFWATPDTVTINLGRRTAGTLDSFKAVDGNEYIVCKFIVPNLNVDPINVEFQSSLPVDDANPGVTQMSVVDVTRSNAIGLLHTIDVWNYATSAFDQVKVDALGVGQVVYTEPVTGVGNHIQAGTRRVRCRIKVKPSGPVSNNAYCLQIDQLQWQVRP